MNSVFVIMCDSLDYDIRKEAAADMDEPNAPEIHATLSSALASARADAQEECDDLNIGCDPGDEIRYSEEIIEDKYYISIEEYTRWTIKEIKIQ